MQDETQQPQQDAPATPVQIVLVFTLDDINAVLSLLRKYPMEQVEPIVQAIRQQTIQQLNQLNANKGEAQ